MRNLAWVKIRVGMCIPPMGWDFTVYLSVFICVVMNGCFVLNMKMNVLHCRFGAAAGKNLLADRLGEHKTLFVIRFCSPCSLAFIFYCGYVLSS